MATRVRKSPAGPSWMELMESCREYAAHPPENKRVSLTEPAAVFDILAPLAAGMERETFAVLILDAKNHLVNADFAATGLVDRVQIHPREVFRLAVQLNGTRVVLAHNHPSGDPTPSCQDIAATRQVVEAGKILGIEVLDHVVVVDPRKMVGGRSYVSFRQENLM